MPSKVTLDSLSGDQTNKAYRPRVGAQVYVLTEDADGKPAVTATLKKPTDEVVADFDRVSQDITRRGKSLERLIRDRADLETRVRQSALDPNADRASLEDELEALEGRIFDQDPTNPDGPSYYVKTLRRRLGVVADLKDADGNEVSADDLTGFHTLVVDRLVEDFKALAFLSGDSRR